MKMKKNLLKKILIVISFILITISTSYIVYAVYLLNGIEIDSSNEVLDYLNNLSTNLDNREFNNKALYKIKKLLFPQKR